MYGHFLPPPPTPYGAAPSPYGHYGSPMPMGPPPVDMAMIARDPTAFEAFFQDQLQTLTFNSKDIISYLTDLALHHKAAMAPIVGQSLDMHITNVQPAYRLPAFYLLDSICKNAGEPYPSMWAPHLLRLFTDSYFVVDPMVQRKMLDMAGTWRHGGPGGTPLFGPEIQAEIDQFIASQVPQVPVHQAGYATTAARALQQPLPARIEALILSTQAQAAALPGDTDLPVRIEALRGLKQVVESGAVSVSDQAKIEAQIATLEKAQPPSVPSTPIAPISSSTPSPPVRQASVQNSPVPVQTCFPSAPLAPMPPASVAAPHPPPTVPVTATPPVPAQAPTPAPSAGDLFSKLLQSGLLNKLPTQTPTPPPAATPAPMPAPTAPGPSPQAEQDERYTREISALSIPWTTHDLMAPNWPDVAQICQEELPFPCKQCGRRFPGGNVGQDSLRQHLDWHFRQNKAVKESIARGQSRIWFPRVEEFVTGGAEDTAFASSRGVGEQEAAQLSAEKEAGLRKLFVPAPSDPDVAATPCAICTEPFHSEYNGDEEEWVWYNTVFRAGTYLHATCDYSHRSLSSHVQRDTTPDPNLLQFAQLGPLPSEQRDGTPVEPATPATPATPDMDRLRLLTPQSDRLDQIKSESGTGGTRKRTRSELEADDAASLIANPSSSTRGSPSSPVPTTQVSDPSAPESRQSSSVATPQAPREDPQAAKEEEDEQPYDPLAEAEADHEPEYDPFADLPPAPALAPAPAPAPAPALQPASALATEANEGAAGAEEERPAKRHAPSS